MGLYETKEQPEKPLTPLHSVSAPITIFKKTKTKTKIAPIIL
jgi:hypothetical protein